MKPKVWIFFLILTGWLIVQISIDHSAVAQEEKYDIGHKEIFGKLQRPSVTFYHDNHIDALEQVGCGACHHVFDKVNQTLVPADGEEALCSECHKAKKEGKIVALRQAYHGSCNGCHRKMKKKGIAAGPTTCGECHKR